MMNEATAGQSEKKSWRLWVKNFKNSAVGILIEWLINIAIIGIIVGVAFPVLWPQLPKAPSNLKIEGVGRTQLSIFNKNGILMYTVEFPNGIKEAHLENVGKDRYIIVTTRNKNRDVLMMVNHRKYRNPKNWKTLSLDSHLDTLRTILPRFAGICHTLEIKDVKIGNFIARHPGNEICILAGDPHWSANFIAIYDETLEDPDVGGAHLTYWTFGATNHIWVGNFDTHDECWGILGLGINNTISYLQMGYENRWKWPRWFRGNDYLYCIFYLEPDEMVRDSKGHNNFQAPDSIYRNIPAAYKRGWYYLWGGKSLKHESVAIVDINGDGLHEMQVSSEEGCYITIKIDDGKIEDVALTDGFFEDNKQWQDRYYLFSIKRIEGEEGQVKRILTPAEMNYDIIKTALEREKEWGKIPYEPLPK